MLSFIFLFYVACESSESSSEILWSGYVYSRDLNGDLSTMDTGTVELIDMDGESLAIAEQPFDGSPSFWRLEFSKDYAASDIAIRIQSKNSNSMLWRSLAPPTTAIWLNGTLFTHSQVFNQYFFSALTDFEIQSLSDGQVAHLWGQPLLPEEWANAEISIVDGEGNSKSVLAISYDESGLPTDDISTKVELFMGFDLAPGNITLTVSLPDGRSAQTIYPAQGGDLLSAIYYTLPATE